MAQSNKKDRMSNLINEYFREDRIRHQIRFLL